MPPAGFQGRHSSWQQQALSRRRNQWPRLDVDYYRSPNCTKQPRMLNFRLSLCKWVLQIYMPSVSRLFYLHGLMCVLCVFEVVFHSRFPVAFWVVFRSFPNVFRRRASLVMFCDCLVAFPTVSSHFPAGTTSPEQHSPTLFVRFSRFGRTPQKHHNCFFSNMHIYIYIYIYIYASEVFFL